MDWKKFYNTPLGEQKSSPNPSSVVNLLKLYRDYVYSRPKKKDDESENDAGFTPNLLKKPPESFVINEMRKDLDKWDNEKDDILEIIDMHFGKRRDSIKKGGKKHTQSTNNEYVDPERGSDKLDIVMSTETEILVSCLDNQSFYERATEEDQKTFIENAAKLLTKAGLDQTDFLTLLLDIGRLASNKSPNFLARYFRLSLSHMHRHSWTSLHLSILNSRGVFVNSLVFNNNMSTFEIMKSLVKCANLMYPPETAAPGRGPAKRSREYYFFLAYLLFRTGSAQCLTSLAKDKEANLASHKLDHTQFPPLFAELCELLRDILLDKQNVNRHDLADDFAAEYLPTETGNYYSRVKGANFYSRLLLSIVYPEIYTHREANKLATKEDYLWYKIHNVLACTGTTQRQEAYRLCCDLEEEVGQVSLNDPEYLNKMLMYAYFIALAGGVMESLRLLLQFVRNRQVQSLAGVFLVYFENCQLFEFQDLRYIAHNLWKVDPAPSHSEEPAYLVRTLLDRKRKVTAELKILLATLLPAPRNMVAVKYAVSENFSEAVQPYFLGPPTTKNGMIMVGPLLQKLINLSLKRNSAKYAILLLAQYSAEVGLKISSFKCFYCIQDVENCAGKFSQSQTSAAILESCCCNLFTKGLSDDETALDIRDMVVYYTLLKNLGPSNKHVNDLRETFNCLQLCVLVHEGRCMEAITFCRKNKILENVMEVLRNESHQIYFNALYSYINAIRLMIANGKQPSELLNPAEASNLFDMLDSAYRNRNTDSKKALDGVHHLLTFVSVAPPR
ncbi:conserved hypothetical protein [Theileria orientalis strain Shintoku]|uniref:Nuclear pore protein n=1 Tax=Theileria orientalis strain Shintoku TaxID=869250 RepID=J4C3B3_THEOR|nr:conserved hypothetical protein [Theileria orientalis strain Shintoku]PVC51865.1 hypothetical protein MACL_00001229 [Theileria orientalis]BAM40141.1 conserved hypothetical protein [Theileria orientalis strain Shintoku]|eukprot:XP_009690442.1 conserved hypothetical protein [Theileria orientalis strain Shintoku]